MAFRRVQEAKEHGFSSHSRGDSGPGDRRWGMRREEKKEQGEDSGKQRAASPETKEGEKEKERKRERGGRRGWMDGIETFGNELSEGFIGQGDRFPRVGVGGENSMAVVCAV